MSVSEAAQIMSPDLFELVDCNFYTQQLEASAENAAGTMLTLGQFAMDFARVQRVPRYDEKSRESDAEHSFMLALVAPEIAAQFYPELNNGLISQFAIVHDLIELETGDVATFALDAAGHAAKEQAEHNALEYLARKLPWHTAQLLLRYEEQVEPEARFVRDIEKNLPILVDILGPGKKVMAEDYDIHTVEELDKTELAMSARLQKMFPEPSHDFLHAIRSVLAQQFLNCY